MHPPTPLVERVDQVAQHRGHDEDLGQAERLALGVVEAQVLDVDAGVADVVEEPPELARLVRDKDDDRTVCGRRLTVLARYARMTCVAAASRLAITARERGAEIVPTARAISAIAPERSRGRMTASSTSCTAGALPTRIWVRPGSLAAIQVTSRTPWPASHRGLGQRLEPAATTGRRSAGRGWTAATAASCSAASRTTTAARSASRCAGPAPAPPESSLGRGEHPGASLGDPCGPRSPAALASGHRVPRRTGTGPTRSATSSTMIGLTEGHVGDDRLREGLLGRDDEVRGDVRWGRDDDELDRVRVSALGEQVTGAEVPGEGGRGR